MGLSGPIYQNSNTPVLQLRFSVSDILREPSQWQRMPESFGFRQIVGGAADSGELKSLCSLIVQKRNLLVVRAADPTAGHNVGDCSDVRIIDFEVRGQRYFFLFLNRSRDITKHPVATRRHARS